MQTVTVKAESRTYDVLIGKGLLDRAGELVSEVSGPCRVCVITDETVETLYAAALEESLKKAGFDPVRFAFPPGETSKNPEQLIRILRFLAEEKLTRSDMIIALGGGVAGDLAGLTASLYLRGVKLIQIPTTLLAMVDSSVGGKTAVDLPEGKNLMGSFYQPHRVICDPEVLATLPEDIFADGCAEVIKYGQICRMEIFDWMKDPKARMEELISECIRIKRDIVQRDEKDTGERQLLNFGHTFGHGIEKCSGYEISHGKAVAIGMVLMARGAARMGTGTEECLHTLVRVIERAGLPTETGFTAEEIFGAVLSDKKRAGDFITLVIPDHTGHCRLERMPVETAKQYLIRGLDRR
ncbi:MAG: 3-dehydroquinate synthase [Firmicutes bacterium]|nr:3-dehydroquinate synthase [Bacillota bacterium]